jgi:hypothetical protein
MKKTFWKKELCAGTALLLAASVLFLFPGEANAVSELKLLEVTGTLVSLDVTADPMVIVLNVEGATASGPLWPGCTFSDEKENSLTLAPFIERYTDRLVTLEIVEDTGEIRSGRPAE